MLPRSRQAGRRTARDVHDSHHGQRTPGRAASSRSVGVGLILLQQDSERVRRSWVCKLGAITPQYMAKGLKKVAQQTDAAGVESEVRDA